MNKREKEQKMTSTHQINRFLFNEWTCYSFFQCLAHVSSRIGEAMRLHCTLLFLQMYQWFGWISMKVLEKRERKKKKTIFAFCVSRWKGNKKIYLWAVVHLGYVHLISFFQTLISTSCTAALPLSVCFYTQIDGNSLFFSQQMSAITFHSSTDVIYKFASTLFGHKQMVSPIECMFIEMHVS